MSLIVSSAFGPSPEPPRYYRVEDLPPGDRGAVAALIVACLPSIGETNDFLFSAETQKLLVEIGLAQSITDTDQLSRWTASWGTEALKKILDPIPNDTRHLVAQILVIAHVQFGSAAGTAVLKHCGSLTQVYLGGEQPDAQTQLQLAYRKLYLAFVQAKQLSLPTFSGRIEEDLGRREQRIKLDRAMFAYLTTSESAVTFSPYCITAPLVWPRP